MLQKPIFTVKTLSTVKTSIRRVRCRWHHHLDSLLRVSLVLVVPGSWVGVRRPIHLSLFLAARPHGFAQDPSSAAHAAPLPQVAGVDGEDQSEARPAQKPRLGLATRTLNATGQPRVKLSLW